MSKFKLDERVKKIDTEDLQRVQRVLDFEGQEAIYQIQLGEKVGTRMRVMEHELEKVVGSPGLEPGTNRL